MAADGASAGTVYVQVDPDATGFWAKFQAQTRPGASKAGDDIGGTLGKSIADAIAKGIRDGLDTSTKAPATKTGTESGGAFADAFRARVDAALRTLPNIKVDADTSQADRELADLRAELVALSDKHIGIDINDAEAAAKVDELSARLYELSTRNPNVRASFDAAAASAELGAFNAEVDRVDGRNVRVDVDASSAEAATSSVSLLAAAGASLGPAIVPAAAAAAGAIAAITPVAIGAAGGIGVVALAAVGVVSAVKAMSAADEQAAASGSSLASKQAKLASSADQVRSAQASLANTVANAADSQRRASEAVSNAELSEADANRQLLTAQQAVTQARIDAARAAQDLASQVAHNQLDQRQAALDTKKAEQELAAARAAAAKQNTPANNTALAEAQLAYDKQLQTNKDLQVSAQRLAQDKAKSDKAGIDGSTQVVSALDRVQKATEAVHKAEQATADARLAYASQERQNEFAITQAKQGVINAERAVQTATTQTAAAGGTALRKMQQAFDDLSPAGQRFALFLYGLQNPLHQLQTAAQEGLLPGVQAGIQALLPTLPRITGYVHAFAAEAGHLAQEAGQAFAAPYWANFTDLLVSKSIPALDQAAHVAYNFAVAGAALIKAFLPLGDNFGEGLLLFSERFEQHALNLQNTQGYRDFLAYVKTEGPIVVHTIGELAEAAVRVVQAIAPLGTGSLTIIRLLAETINAMPVPALTALAGGIAAVVTGMKAMSLAQTVLKTTADPLAAVQLVFGQAVNTAKTAMVDAGPQVGAFSRTLAAVRGGASGAAGGIAALAGDIGTGGILGIALAAGTLLIGAFANAHQKAVEKEAQHRNTVQQLTDAIDKNNGAIDENVRKIAAKQALDDGALKLARETGISLGAITNAYIAGGSAIDSVIAQLENYITAQQVAEAHDEQHSSTYTKNIKNARDLIGVLKDQQKAIDDQSASTSKAAYNQGLLNEAMGQVTNGVYQQSNAQKALGDALNKLGDSSVSAADKAAALKAADDAVFSSIRNTIHAQEDAALSTAKWNDLIAAAKTRHDQFSSTLDLNKAKTVEQTQEVINNRRALEDRFTALNQEFIADTQAGIGLDAATKKHDANRAAIVKAAQAAGFDKDQVNQLADAFGTLPTNPKVQVTVSGVAEALTQLQNLEIAQLALKQGLDPSAATKEWKAQHAQAQHAFQGLATGGPVFGPGGPTDDQIPAWLSNGEHVWTAAEVRAAGGHAAVEELRRKVLGPRGPQVLYPGDGSAGIAFARGGAVRWPFPTTAAITRIPSLAEVRKAVTFGPDWTGPVSDRLQAAADFVRAQVGKPYVWASAGPYGYDCSGLLSAAWNVAHGRNPYSHTFSTMNEAPFFPIQGYGAFTAGWTNPGEPGPGGSSVGHTAGKIGNMPFESAGGVGVRTGPGVTSISRFAHIGHFAGGGPVLQLRHVGSYDAGGGLPPGLTLAYNGTGSVETVRTADQEAALTRGGDTHFHAHGTDAELLGKLQAMTDRQQVLSRIGRPH